MITACGGAQSEHNHSTSQYTGQESREIKTLSAAQVQGYLNGEGMEMAKAAELNGYPGPRHVLDNEAELQLSAAQRDEIQRSFHRMHSSAAEIGKQIVDAERELDRMFKEGRADSNTLSETTAKISRLQGELRAVHLKAHLETKAVLSVEQIEKYRSLRGYTRQ